MWLSSFQDPKDTPPPTRVETKDERKERKVRDKARYLMIHIVKLEYF